MNLVLPPDGFPDGSSDDGADVVAWLVDRRRALCEAFAVSHISEWSCRVLGSRRERESPLPLWTVMLCADVGQSIAILFPEDLMPIVRYASFSLDNRLIVLGAGVFSFSAAGLVGRALIVSGRPRAGYVSFMMLGIAANALMRSASLTRVEAAESEQVKAEIVRRVSERVRSFLAAVRDRRGRD